MDIVADTLTSTVEWAPVARTMMDQLTKAERAQVNASVDQAAHGFDPSHFQQITPGQLGQQPFFVLRATPNLRILFLKTEDRVAGSRRRRRQAVGVLPR
jgi:hypothetical protein